MSNSTKREALWRVACAAVWLLLALPAIGEESPSAGEPTRDYFPLAVGNCWEYRATYRLASGTTLNATATLTVEGVEMIQGNAYFKAVSKVRGVLSDPTTTKYYRRGDNGVFEASKKRGAKEILLLPTPIKSGMKWSAELPNELFLGKVTSHQQAIVGLTVSGDGVSYEDCVKVSSKVESRLGSVQHDQWLAPGVGIVKQSQRSKLWTMDSVLTKFSRRP